VVSLASGKGEGMAFEALPLASLINELENKNRRGI
jgi:hypothetical protein